MKPAPFEYIAPNSLREALHILAEKGGEAKVLAGGQSLVPAMNFRLVQPGLLVDLDRIPELATIRRASDGGLRLGAMTRQRRLERDPVVAEVAPLLHETMPHVAHVQIRNRGTLGGSLAHADPAAELPVIMVALDGRFRLQSAAGERWVAAGEFFQGLFTTALAPEEVLVEVAVPPRPPRTGWAFVEFARRRGDYALLGVAALLTLDENGVCRQARLVYLNAGETPVNARQAATTLVGEEPSPERFAAAAEVAVEKEINPGGDIHASAAYLRHLARVLTRRALETAVGRVRS
ncbi:MAG: xanthine dehydrogenase family protein subunit M [Chloroflexi bacterium]|nr:xanthine dehydrogenase family protein subunit M [Chloroflexota bacterium]MCI0576412.1 xanthine dehydrogenase family protein subunit M [Chloroflexota bacterium]MCI0644284.1 xanthine dehydrogenase family protein subunit M [Chloroflexota bacterium]MCI0726267.1 xanthine dehydrogenase family protein subunit M [Chloroflexota bacterium]